MAQQNRPSSAEEFISDSGKAIIPIIIVAIVIFVALGSYVIVQPGHVGVIVTLGQVNMEALPEGFALKKPIMDKIEQIDIRLSATTASAQSASKDLQIVTTEVKVQFSLNADVAPQIFQRIGRRDAVSSTVIEPAILESVKAVTARYTAEELVTQRAIVKEKIQETIDEFIRTTLADKEIPTAVIISNVAITDFKFSDEFNKAIEMKVKAEQKALQAVNEKDQLVTQAEAAKAVKLLAADAAAYQITTESKARAAAIEREAKALLNHPELIQLRLAEKWDGRLPRFTGGNAVPFLNVDQMMQGN